MKYLSLVFIFSFVSLIAKESFITPKEYAQQLYKNPRGISCKPCHGDRGEGNIIATYRDNGELKTLKGPAINKLSFREFAKKMNSSNSGMPRYYLIDSEIKALYLHIHLYDKKKQKDNNES